MLKEIDTPFETEPGVAGDGFSAAAGAAEPAWFRSAIALQPARGFTRVDGARIETLIWGERGKPGLLFLPGNSAQADWWSFIAPFFAGAFRVAAISWSGMGRSDWRENYSIEQHMREAWLCAEDAGLFDCAVKPVFAAHSFGGGIAMKCARYHGERLRKAVIVDNGVWLGDLPPARPGPPHRVYTDRAEAIARFRLRPEQSCANPYLLNYIAQHAIAEVRDPRDGSAGWTWRFDPQAQQSRGNRHMEESHDTVRNAACPLAFIHGDRSRLMSPRRVAETRAAAPAGSVFVGIPDCAHHVMVDQPLALVTALRLLVAPERSN